ncbi:ABC transporter ATP-binding protein [Aeoliella mucimassa]|uniref:Macrolide export ATP-binding/permease protein MacB n=1 Tax=Aeoliella mucimassa TaxID=2527972 RepID=A0A518ATL1_9BACT|nr:ABC transporter ATP-binding protein [Aeoliella mucimassa]QDU58062.1 Macrolide export ATP-binding/permease protein MacB [Aeoliella mucimassa]
MQTHNEHGSAPPLELTGLTKRFRQGSKEITALDDVSLTVAAGEFVAVMGASGSGKSTLLHLAAGLTDASSGTVRVDGQDLSALSDKQLTHFRRREIGLVFQSLNLVPALTAEENVLLPLYAAADRSHRVKLAGELLDQLGLGDRRTHRPSALSGGEQQRVAIARSLVTEPAIVLADEPTGSLDSTNGQLICQVIRKLNDEQQRTVVIVTHEPSVAIWADRIVVLKDGKLESDFAASSFTGPQELASHYQQITSPTEQTELVHGVV